MESRQINNKKTPIHPFLRFEKSDWSTRSKCKTRNGSFTASFLNWKLQLFKVSSGVSIETERNITDDNDGPLVSEDIQSENHLDLKEKKKGPLQNGKWGRKCQKPSSICRKLLISFHSVCLIINSLTRSLTVHPTCFSRFYFSFWKKEKLLSFHEKTQRKRTVKYFKMKLNK